MMSSLRKQGPIATVGSFWAGWGPIQRDNQDLWLWVPAFAGTTEEFNRMTYRLTRSNSFTSTSSASASITPPHTVSRSGITMRFAGG
jgi:hypothetical protein